MLDIINNPKLSLKAKGLYYVLKHTDLTKFKQTDLVKSNKNGKSSIESAFKELKDNHLLRITKTKTGKPVYHLSSVKSISTKDKDIVRLLVTLFEDNRVFTKTNKFIDDKLLRMVKDGFTFGGFVRAIKIWLYMLDLSFSNKYRYFYARGYVYRNYDVGSPLNYIFSLVKRSQTAYNLEDVRDLSKQFPVDDKYKTKVYNDNKFNADVFKSSLYHKYFK